MRFEPDRNPVQRFERSDFSLNLFSHPLLFVPFAIVLYAWRVSFQKAPLGSVAPAAHSLRKLLKLMALGAKALLLLEGLLQ